MKVFSGISSFFESFRRGCSICGRTHREYECPMTSDARRERARALVQADSARLDYLEKLARGKGGILLHNGNESGRRGIALKPGKSPLRTLRQAIDESMRSASVITSRASDAELWDSPQRE
jgi:recombinational DNA repair protein RecR